MSQMPIEANVVLTADNSQYDASMSASADTTGNLAKAVDSLSGKISSLTKSAGRKSLGIAAADIASITAATVAFGAYEKQMTSLNVQAAVLNKNLDAQKKTFTGYSRSVGDLRKEFSMTTSEAAALVQVLSRVNDNTANIDKVSASFAKLGLVTGESSTALATSMTQLQKTMGTPLRETEKYNQQLAVLSQRSNASAQSILEFSQSIAPVGRMVNMSQTDIMGFSNAFIKAGQDGYRASTVFSRMVSDIAYATQTGSPDLAKYANLVGMTTAQFKELGGTEQILQVFDSINRQGPQAITTLNRMGLDGINTVKTVTAMAQQGGMVSEINAARNADPGAMNRGAKTAMQGMTDSFKNMREELLLTGEALGKVFAGPAKVFLTTIELMATAVRKLAESPLGKVAAWAMMLAAPFTAIAGAVLMASKALATFAAVSMLTRGALGAGFRETRGLDPAARAIAGIPGGRNTTLVPGGSIGARSAANASWTTRGLYNAGAGLGRMLPAPDGPGLISRGVGYTGVAAGGLSRFIGGAIYGPGATYIPGVRGSGGYDDLGRRQRFFSSPTVGGSVGWTRDIAGAAGRTMNRVAPTFMPMFAQGMMNTRMTATGEGFRTLSGGSMSYDDANRINQRYDQLTKSRTGGISTPSQRLLQATSDVERASTTARAMGQLERQTMSASRGFSAFARGLGNVSMLMGATALSAGRLGGGIAKSAYSLVGGNPLLLGGLAAFGTYKFIQGMKGDQEYDYQDRSGAAAPYYAAGNLQAPGSISEQLTADANNRRLTLAQARNISDVDRQAAESGSYQLVNENLKGIDTIEGAVAKLTPDWGNLVKSPTAVNTAALDLTKLLGSSDAQKAIDQLFTGGEDPFYLATEGVNAESVGFTDTMMRARSGSVTTDKLNEMFGIIDDQASVINATQGSQEALEYKGESLATAVKTFVNDPAYNYGNEPDTVFKQAVAKQAFGLDTEEIKQYAMVNKFDDLKSFIEAQVTGTGGYLNPEYAEGGRANLEKALGMYEGVDTSLSGQEAADAIYNAIMNPPKSAEEESANSAANAIKDASKEFFGSTGILGLASVRRALGSGAEDVNAQYAAVNEIVQMSRASGKSWGGQQRMIGNLSALSSDDPSLGAALLSGAQAQLQRAQSFRAPYQNRVTNFTEQTDIYANAMKTNLGTEGMAARDQAQTAYQAQVQDQYSYFKQLLLQQREFEISRERGEDDYNLQREYAQDDFDKQRFRAEADFARMRGRAQADYDRQVRRSRHDFHLSRKRQEEDYHHSVEMMVEQQARSMSSIYQRIEVQRTSSAGWLLFNAQEQLEAMRGQSQDLDTLRGAGLSDNAIQQLGLTDPQNAQQLSRLVADVAENPQLIRQFNESVAKRLKAAENLVTDESSTEWQEFRRQYNRSRRHAQEDFARSMMRGRDDFKRSLEHQNDDFKRSLTRQNEDFDLSMDRMADQFNTAMDRAAADLNRAAKTIDGNFEEILTKSMNRLGGHAKKQAQQVVAEFRNLKSSTSPHAIDLMMALSDIFGIKYNPPKGGGNNFQHSSGHDNPGSNNSTYTGGGGHAAGGVLPGRSIGRDDMHFRSPVHGDLHLAGGEAIMVPEWVDAIGGPAKVREMNDAARYKRSYASGGVTPAAGQWTQHTSGYPWARWAGDINVPGDSDMGNPVKAWKSGIVAAVEELTTSYGKHVKINHSGSNEETLYAHLSKIGVKAGDMVRAGQVIGNVGSTGNSSGPHLHFEIKGGTSAIDTSGIAGASPRALLRGILQDQYPGIERTVDKLQGVNPFGKGTFSKMINNMARQAFSEMKDQSVSGAGAADGHDWPSSAPMPSGKNTNQALVRKAMLQAGYRAKQWDPLHELVMRESGFNHMAQNPDSTAFGMFQFLDSTWAGVGGHKTNDPWLQSVFGMRYIKDRYGNPNKALKFHDANNWYGDGSIFTGAQTIGVGERGPETVIPLNERGAEFIADIFRRTSVGQEGRRQNVPFSQPSGSVNNYSYQIDKSTSFTGPITVQANDPNQFISQLKSRERARALTQPAIGGSRI